MGRRYSYAFIGLALLASAVPAHTATRLVQSGEDLQAALDAAVPGDVILLQAGATFCGNFVLPVKSGADCIVLRSSAADVDLPAVNARVTPAAAPRLARLISPNTLPAVSTAPGAHHWKLQFLELGPNSKGYGEVVAIGDGGVAQYDPSQVPYAIVLDRLYLHGDPLSGQKRGVALNGRDVTIRGSYISDIKAIGQDSQAIGGWNGPGGMPSCSHRAARSVEEGRHRLQRRADGAARLLGRVRRGAGAAAARSGIYGLRYADDRSRFA